MEGKIKKFKSTILDFGKKMEDYMGIGVEDAKRSIIIGCLCVRYKIPAEEERK